MGTNKRATKEDIDLFGDATVLIFKVVVRDKVNPNWQAKIKIPNHEGII